MNKIRPWLYTGKYRETLNQHLLSAYQIKAMLQLAEPVKQPGVTSLYLPEAELTTSVCTGSFLLAKANLLTGKAVTTHWASIQRMRDDFPNLEVKENVRWVDSNKIVTGAGVSVGIDMSLH